MDNYFRGGGDGIVASLEARQQLTQVVDRRLQRRHVLQDGKDVSAGVQHPALVEGLQKDSKEKLFSHLSTSAVVCLRGKKKKKKKKKSHLGLNLAKSWSPTLPSGEEEAILRMFS